MLKKYMLKLTNTVGTVQYLGKITKENDKNNNCNSNDDEGSSGASSKSSGSVFGRKHKKKYRNSMTAEMLLDIGGPLHPAVGGRSHSLAPIPQPDNTPPGEYHHHLHPHNHHHHLLHTSDSSLFEDRLEPSSLRCPPPHPQRAAYHRSRSLNECDTAAYRRARLLTECAAVDSAGTSPPQLSSTDEDDEEEDNNNGNSNDDDVDSDEDPMAVLSAAILDLRNTLLYYSLVCNCVGLESRNGLIPFAQRKQHAYFTSTERHCMVPSSRTLRSVNHITQANDVCGFDMMMT